MIRRLIPFSLLILLQGCADDGLHLQTGDRQIINWHRMATEDDRTRLGHWRDNMVTALKAARAADAQAVDASGVVLLPDAALEPVAITSGQYRCQMLKLGVQDHSTAAFRITPVAPCTVVQEGKLLRFAMRSGLQRPQGLIYAENNRRMVMLGTLVVGDEAMAQIYSHDATRDLIGIVERIGNNHWRILLPAPHFESLFDVIDITPA